MRLLSIFALLFLISILLHDRMEKRPVPVDVPNVSVASGPAEDPASVVQDASPPPPPLPPPPAPEDFSALIFDKPYPVGHFGFEEENAFSQIELELKNLIMGRYDDGFKMTNHFCAVGYEFARVQTKKRSTVKREVIVYWREGGALYRWSGGDAKAAARDFYSASSLLFSARSSIPLDTVQLGSEDEKSQADADEHRKRTRNVVSDCEKHGKSYVIDPFTPPPRGFKMPERRRPPASPVTPVTPHQTQASSPLV